jgi:hypothetical protein
MGCAAEGSPFGDAGAYDECHREPEISIDIGMKIRDSFPKFSSQACLFQRACPTATFYVGIEIGRESLNDTIESIS